MGNKCNRLKNTGEGETFMVETIRSLGGEEENDTLIWQLSENRMRN